MDKIFFETKVRGSVIGENGERKLGEYNFFVVAPDFSGAEMSTLEDVASLMEDASCKAIKISNVNEIVNNDCKEGKYYKVKVVMYIYDETSQRESKVRVVYLVNAESPVDADKVIRAYVGNCSFDISDISETKICDILYCKEKVQADAE